jgi:hypothetical protein
MIWSLPILAALRVFWDDPNPPEMIGGYNVYVERNLGTGQLLKIKLNLELIPWMEDGEKTPFYIIRDAVYPMDQLSVTAVGKGDYAGQESEQSERLIIPFPPVKVPSFIATND